MYARIIILKKQKFVSTEVIRSFDNRTSDLSKGRVQEIKEASANGTWAFLTRKERTFKKKYRA